MADDWGKCRWMRHFSNKNERKKLTWALRMWRSLRAPVSTPPPHFTPAIIPATYHMRQERRQRDACTNLDKLYYF